MHVIGTAGHVDHGKSSLVQRLTGIDPDRLDEEKARGMTIDLGFAWMKLPRSGATSIVDVPGHERFIKNMLAGVGGIDLALLVIAADEGVMPQTVEHVQILDLLRVRRGVVALTKVDLVDADWRELVQSEVGDFLGATGISDAPIVPVSSLTGEGIGTLCEALDDALTQIAARPDFGRPRIPIDRSFTMPGFGTVITGTLAGGSIEVGQELTIVPGGVRARARGIQVHRERVNRALPGHRVAVNLAGVTREEAPRGLIVTVPGWLDSTLAADVDLRIVREAAHPLQHGMMVTFHTGAAEIEARVLLLERDSLGPGERGWGQLRFSEPAALVRGDLFVIRSPDATLGGGEVVDPQARRHRRRERDLASALTVLREGSPADTIRAEVARRGNLEERELMSRTGLDRAAFESLVERLSRDGDLISLGDVILSPARWDELTGRAKGDLEAFHHEHPLRPGMAREVLRTRVGLSLRAFGAALARLVGAGIIVDDRGTVSRPGFAPTIDGEAADRAARLERVLMEAGLTPPGFGELPTDCVPDADLAHALHAQGRIVLVAADLAFARSAFDRVRSAIEEHLRDRGTITVAGARDLLGTSRKYALAILEHLDRQHVTRRVGDERRLAVPGG